MTLENYAKALFLVKLGRVYDQLPESQKETYRQAAAQMMAPEPEPSRLIPDWRDVLKRAHSIRLAAVLGAVFYWALTNLDVVYGVYSQAPPEIRSYVPLPLSIAGTVIVILSRLWAQKKPLDRPKP